MIYNKIVYIILFLTTSLAYGQNSTEYEDSMLNIARNSASLGDIDHAIEICYNFVNPIVKPKDRKIVHPEKIWHELSLYLSKRGSPYDINEAIEAANKSLELYNSTSIRERLTCMHDLAFYYVQHEDYDKANKTISNAINLLGNTSNFDNLKLACQMRDNYERLSYYSHNPSVFQLALLYAEKYFSIVEEYKDSDMVGYISTLNDMASYYNSDKNFSQEVKYLEIEEPLVKKLYGEQSGEYLEILYRLALCYNLLKDRERYELWETKLRDLLVNIGIYESVDVKEVPLYTQKAMNNANDGLFVDAIKNEMIALNISASKKDSVSMAHSYNEISNYYYMDKDVYNAMLYASIAIDLYEQKQDKSIDYALALNNISVYCHELNDDQKALNYAKTAMQMFENVSGADSLQANKDLYAKILRNVSLYSNGVGLNKDAAKYNKLSNEYKLDGLDTRSIIDIRINDAIIAYNAGNYADLQLAYHEALRLQNKELMSACPSSSKWEDIYKYWEGCKSIYNYALTFGYGCGNKQPSLLPDVYNAIVVRKQIEQIHQVDTTNYISVVNKLRDDEMAIEFFNIESSNLGNAYAALLIKHGWTAPKCIKLFTNSDLTKIQYAEGTDFWSVYNSQTNNDQLYSDVRIGKLIWQNIVPEFNGIKKVYISTIGLLDDFRIEDLPYEDNNVQENVLSSTYSFERVCCTAKIDE